MALSPNDIRHYEFETQMRGYNKEEVADLLDQIAVAMEAEKQESLKLSMEVESLRTQLSTLKEFEDSIKKAAIDARHNADQMVQTAKADAAQMLDQAKQEAESMVAEQKEMLRDLEARVQRAKVSKQTYLDSLRELMESHLKILEHIDTAELEDLDDNLEVTDSSEVERDKMETLAESEPESENDSGPIKTEDANAAGEVVPAEPQEPNPRDGVDPSLKEALAGYQAKVDGSSGSDQPSDDKGDEADIVETDRLAEEVPPGFFARDPQTGEDITGKIRIAHAKMAAQKHANPDKPADPPDVDPKELAESLDKVVEKFEEELDKAAQSQ